MSLSSSPVKNLRIRLYTNTYYQDLKGDYNNIKLSERSFVYNARLNISYKFLKNVNIKISQYYRSNKASIFQNNKGIIYTNASLNFDLFKKRLSIDIRASDIFNTRKRISEYYLNNFYHYSEKTITTQRIQFALIFRIGNSKFDRQAKVNQLAR